MEKIKGMLTENPSLLGLVFVVFGVVGLLGAIFNWKWLFKDVSGVTYSLKKIDGWVNMFGVKTARIVYGILCVVVILTGALWFFLSTFGR
ncbi:flagellar biosynthesis protein FlhB [Dysgonomonas hofstadii]|uniref:Flagellar biosynthesis protein FlhB n=1 Tax=Dysgonomonas hofstadii TaxID=637886 RepID=A0A840CPE1_9BACT|nr:Imm17 family immunity protein [Dysgonomonas hofstadii]MBB4034835.1 flagellar biosynthesis protein FlhB [Dysgonomonas hofstadii]